MKLASQTISWNARLLKSKVNRYALTGVLISFCAIIIGTILSSYFQFHDISLKGFIEAQKTNMGLWVLDAMPFMFAVWGQYTGSMLSYEASAMLVDQTQELRDQTSALEQKAMHGATHDALTDLPNRVLFHDRLTQAVNTARRAKTKLAVMLLDLDNFKEVNDTMGHYNGDRLLKQVAMRLGSVIRESDTLARLGGDEFAILLPEIRSDHDIETVTAKIQNALQPSFMLEGLNIDVQVSMGAVVFPENGEDADTLLQRVDVAMYVAKQEGKDFVVYSPKMDKHSPHRLTLIGELRQALEKDNLMLFYQPKVDGKNNTVIGAEALVRWDHPTHGMMPPDEFISLAERTGLIKNLTRWVLKTALHQSAVWQSRGIDLVISVNLSTRNLLDPELPDLVAGLLASYGIAPRYLMLEITETTIMEDPESALEIIHRIAKMGVHFSIDDFGTGYSSLAYLKKLPISEIKIDKSFVMEMLTSENDEVIVHTTIDLAHNLGLKVVAEGVETKETLARLNELGCDVLQGFYISRPVDAENFSSWYTSSGWGEETG